MYGISLELSTIVTSDILLLFKFQKPTLHNDIHTADVSRGSAEENVCCCSSFVTLHVATEATYY